MQPHKLNIPIKVILAISTAFLIVKAILIANDAKGKRHIDRGETTRLNEFVINKPRLATALLEHSYKRNNKAAFRVLLAAGANAEGYTSQQMPMIHLAAKDEDPYWLRQILTTNADPNLYKSRPYPTFPIDAAIEHNRPENVRALIAGGADLNSSIPRGYSFLADALGMWHGECAYILLLAGIDYNPPLKWGRSPIAKIQASRYGTVSFANDLKKEKDERYLLNCLDWFNDHALDVMNAKFPGKPDEIRRWHIPKLPDSDERKGKQKVSGADFGLSRRPGDITQSF